MKDDKQAEFLVYGRFPFDLVDRIGVRSARVQRMAEAAGGGRMIEYKTGDILAEDAEALVNTVNCVGFMGRGIALEFKRAWPENFMAYAAACRKGKVQPGRMFVSETGQLGNPRYIINFPTKRHWRGKSRIEDIEAGLEALVAEVRNRGIRSIAVPPLGSGLGGLDWADVRPRIEQAMKALADVRVVVFEPHKTAAPGRSHRARKVPAMTPGRAALAERGWLTPANN
jgi:O-acetyl-ADP-ribose deacetylase (regulator of RNase III)